MEKATRRDILRLAPAAAAAVIIPTAAFGSAIDVEHPMNKIRRLANELSEALAAGGVHEYAYVRPAGIEYPVLLANKSNPAQIAQFYFREYEEAVESVAIANKQVHIHAMSHLISRMIGQNACDAVLIRPANTGKLAVSVFHDIDTPL